MILVDYLKRKIVMSYILSFLRHALTLLAGYLLSQGLIDQSAADAFVNGSAPVFAALILWLIGQAASIAKIAKGA